MQSCIMGYEWQIKDPSRPKYMDEFLSFFTVFDLKILGQGCIKVKKEFSALIMKLSY